MCPVSQKTLQEFLFQITSRMGLVRVILSLVALQPCLGPLEQAMVYSHHRGMAAAVPILICLSALSLPWANVSSRLFPSEGLQPFYLLMGRRLLQRRQSSAMAGAA